MNTKLRRSGGWALVLGGALLVADFIDGESFGFAMLLHMLLVLAGCVFTVAAYMDKTSIDEDRAPSEPFGDNPPSESTKSSES